MNLLQKSTAAIGVASLLLFVGCFGDPDYGIVHGEATFQGKPIREGQVIFTLIDNSASEGGVIQDGRFESKAPLGECVVRINAREVVRGVPGALDREDYLTKEIIPKKYNDDSELRLDVVAGPQQHDFKLE